MYAVIQTGGKQYRVSEGDYVRVDRMDGDVGSEITLDQVIMVAGEGADPKVGTPTIAGASVKAEIVGHRRAKKIVVFKMKRRKNYRRKNGHRQHYTQLKVTGISA